MSGTSIIAKISMALNLNWIAYFNSLLFFGLSGISAIFPVIRVFPVYLVTNECRAKKIT